MIGAVIYARVSTKEQTDNLSLDTQLRACEDYCDRQGLTVVHRFVERGESAKTSDRTELQKLLAFCRTHKARVSFVIVYSLNRFAREKYDHFALRAYLNGLAIALRSVTEPIDETSTGKLMEGVLASFAQFDNDVRSERTRAGMRAAMERGRWTFLAPLGYLNSPRYAGTSLVPDPVRAPLVRQAFDAFATGRYTKREILAQLTAGGFTNRAGQPPQPQTITNMLANAVYVGRIEVRGGISVRGDFEALVDEATFYRAQAILTGRLATTGPPARNHPDFPLRGFVRCHACGHGLTGSWSKGRTGRYAYYHCGGRHCRAVNVSKAALEGQFVDRLAALQPTPGFMRLVTRRVLQVWQALRSESRDAVARAEREVRTIQDRLDRLDDAFLFAQTIDQETYDRQRHKLREGLASARVRQHETAIEDLDVEGILHFAEQVLPSAAQLWSHASLDQRQRLQQLFFAEGMTFDGNQLIRTAVTMPFFSDLAGAQGGEIQNGRPPYGHIEPSYHEPEPRPTVDVGSLTRWLRQLESLRTAA